MRTWGELLEDAATLATHSVVLVAPFIKKEVLGRLLARAAPQVVVEVFTRWRPDEVAAGVSDLEALDVVQQRPQACLRLLPSLHAKYYRFDDKIWIGSANLTGAALGWSRHPNLELLHYVQWPQPTLTEFESLLRTDSVPASDDIRRQVADAAAALPQPVTPVAAVSSPEPSGPFLPRTRHPEQLLLLYVGRSEDLTAAAQSQATMDLVALAPPSGLGDAALRAFVGAELLQNVVVGRIDELAASPRRFGEVRALLATHLRRIGSDRDPSEAAQTLLRWLLFFLPGRYTLGAPGYSEILVRRQ